MKKKELEETQYVFHVLLTFTGYVCWWYLLEQEESKLEEKPAHSYLGNLCKDTEPIQVQA